MKLAEIKTKKLLLAYIAEIITKKVDFEAVYNVVMVQKEVNCAKAALEDYNESKLTAALSRLNKLNGGLERIQKLASSITVSGDVPIMKRFDRYLK